MHADDDGPTHDHCDRVVAALVGHHNNEKEQVK